MLARTASETERDEERSDLRLRDALAAHGMLPMADSAAIRPDQEAGETAPTTQPG